MKVRPGIRSVPPLLLLMTAAASASPARAGESSATPAASPPAVSPAGGDQGLAIDLPTALRLAGAENLEVKVARERLAQAEAANQSALLQFFPWVSVGAAYRRHENRIQDVVGNLLDTEKQSYSPGVALAAQVDLGDAIYRKLAAKQLVDAAREALAVQSQNSILEAAAGYFELTRAHAAVEIAGEALRTSKDYQAQLEAAVGAGLAFRGDALRVQVQTERYGIALRQAVERERIAAAGLARTLHLDPAVALWPRDPAPVSLTLIPPTSSLETLVDQALATRSELRQAGAVISAADATDRGAKYGPLIPTIGGLAFVGGLGGGTHGATDTFGDTEDYAVFLNWRIGPGGLFDTGRIKSAEARLAEARVAEKITRDQVVQQIVENHTRVRSLADQLIATQASLATTTETLRLTSERKEFAVGAVLEVIQSQQDLTRARYDYMSTIAEYDKAQYALSRALGGPLE
jgi:outer membrane protein TolC